MKAGAADFVTKPWTNQQMLQSVPTALGLAGVARRRRRRPAAHARGAGRALRLRRGRSAATRGCSGSCSWSAAWPRPTRRCSITGESGTGKELVAEAIHRNSRRAPARRSSRSTSAASRRRSSRARCSATCAAPSPTPAPTARAASRSPHGGTIFLDEIGELDAGVAGEAAARPAGPHLRGARLEPDARPSTSASSRPPTARWPTWSTRGEFREDLLYRINLIARAPAAAARAARRHPDAGVALRAGGGAQLRPRRRSPSARPRSRGCSAQPWPGNVRQLRQWIERAALVEPARPARRGRLRGHHRHGAARRGAATRCPPVGSMTMDEIERAMIVKSLRHHGGNITPRGRVAGPEPRGALPPLREVRDQPCEPRGAASSSTSSSCTPCSRPWPGGCCSENSLWLIAVEVVFVVVARRRHRSSSRGCLRRSRSCARARSCSTRASSPRGSSRSATRTSTHARRVYNRMVDNLREERVRLQEQQYFLGQLLAVSPAGVDRPRPRRPRVGRQPRRGAAARRRRRRRAAGRSPTRARRSPRRSPDVAAGETVRRRRCSTARRVRGQCGDVRRARLPARGSIWSRS